MKKFLLIILSIAMLALCACGTPSGDNATPGEVEVPASDANMEDPKVDPVVKSSAELVAMGYKAEDESGRMFDASGAGIYNYCPTMFEADDGVRHIYYCTNKKNQQIYDYIGYRSAIKASDTGVWYYSPESLVLAPQEKVTVTSVEDYSKSSFSWYSLHICDPSVIKGEFKYKSHTYKYLMAVLVCANPYCLDNEIALAVADKPEGPWKLLGDDVNPVVLSARDMAGWGVGQPDIISIDKKGQVWMLYTMHGIGAVWQAYDMSDLSDIKTLSNMTSPNKTGTATRDEYGTHQLYNSAYAWDNNEQQLYMITEKFPHALDSEPTYPDQVGSVQELFKYGLKGYDPLKLIKYSNSGTWKSLYQVTPKVSGKPRNHNACIIRDEWGWLPSVDTIELAVTVNDAGNTGNNNTYLWDYRIARFEYNK